MHTDWRINSPFSIRNSWPNRSSFYRSNLYVVGFCFKSHEHAPPATVLWLISSKLCAKPINFLHHTFFGLIKCKTTLSRHTQEPRVHQKSHSFTEFSYTYTIAIFLSNAARVCNARKSVFWCSYLLSWWLSMWRKWIARMSICTRSLLSPCQCLPRPTWQLLFRT